MSIGWIAQGVLLPFWGTTLGAALVFFLRKRISSTWHQALSGFAAGVMVAASFWSLMQPALESSAAWGRWAFVPAAVGFSLGIGLMLVLDRFAPDSAGASPRCLRRTGALIFAVTLHNIPEGMAVGAVFAGWRSGEAGITGAGAMALALGIAIQNFPEGAIVSLPLRLEGAQAKKAFGYGVLSGAVEPAAALITLWAAGTVLPVLPYLLAFAAGAMLYVVALELIPPWAQPPRANHGILAFAAGFVVMMVLDVALG